MFDVVSFKEQYKLYYRLLETLKIDPFNRLRICATAVLGHWEYSILFEQILSLHGQFISHNSHQRQINLGYLDQIMARGGVH